MYLFKDANKNWEEREDWKNITREINNIYVEFDNIKKVGLDLDKRDLENINDKLEKLIKKINKLKYDNVNKFYYFHYNIYEYLKNKIVMIYDEINEYISEVNNKIKSDLVKKYPDKFLNEKFAKKFMYVQKEKDEKIKRKDNPGLTDTSHIMEAHSFLKKQIIMIPDEPLQENVPNYLANRIIKCIKNYEEHYGETPSNEIISDILGVKIESVSQVMNELNIENKNAKKL